MREKKTERKILIRVSRVISVIKCLFYSNQALLRWDQTVSHYVTKHTSMSPFIPVIQPGTHGPKRHHLSQNEIYIQELINRNTEGSGLN